MKHFTLNDYQNARVNKLHEAFNDLLGAESNRIVDKDVFIKELKKKVEEPTPLDKELQKLYLELKDEDALSARYESILVKIERLTALKPPVKEKKRVSPDALIGVGGNLAHHGSWTLIDHTRHDTGVAGTAFFDSYDLGVIEVSIRNLHQFSCIRIADAMAKGTKTAV